MIEGKRKALQQVVYTLGNIVGLGLAVYKCQVMGLLPTHPSDWLAFVEPQKVKIVYRYTWLLLRMDGNSARFCLTLWLMLDLISFWHAFALLLHPMSDNSYYELDNPCIGRCCWHITWHNATQNL